MFAAKRNAVSRAFDVVVYFAGLVLAAPVLLVTIFFYTLVLCVALAGMLLVTVYRKAFSIEAPAPPPRQPGGEIQPRPTLCISRERGARPN